MAQHFFLSAKARTLSLVQVARMSDDEARATFRAIRWAATDGEPVCPKCGCLAVYEYASRPIFKCKGCMHQFSLTSGTIFASRKLPVRDYLLAIAIFVNGVKGVSTLQLSRDLVVQYKTAYVLAHKLREAMAAEQRDRQPSWRDGRRSAEERAAGRRARVCLLPNAANRRGGGVPRSHGPGWRNN